MLQLTCSHKPRPSVHGGRPSGFYKTGACLWGRDVHHVRIDNGNTLCGRKTTDWLVVDAEIKKDDDNLCRKCAVYL